MSRKKIWFYTLVLCTAFTITLAGIAPPLALAPMAFTVIYMLALTGSLLLAWLFDGIRYSRPLIMLATCLMLGVFLLVGGSVIGAGVAVLLTLLVYRTHARTNRRPPAPAPDYSKPPQFGYHLSYGHPVEQAARQQ